MTSTALFTLTVWQCCCCYCCYYGLIMDHPSVIELAVFLHFSPESCSPPHRSTSCWSTTPMPSSTTRNIVMLPASTPWPCSRRRCSAKRPRFAPRLEEPLPMYRLRWATSDVCHCCVHTSVLWPPPSQKYLIILMYGKSKSKTLKFLLPDHHLV